MSNDKGFTNDAIPALSVCESPIEGKFVQAFFDLMTELGMVAEYAPHEDAKVCAVFHRGSSCEDEFLINCSVGLFVQWSCGCYRYDAYVNVSNGRNTFGLAVELDGKAFHSSPDQLKRDGEKTVACFELGVPLMRIPGAYVYSNAHYCAASALSHCRFMVERVEYELHSSFSLVHRAGIRHQERACQ